MRPLTLLLSLTACAHHTTGHEALQAVDAYQRASAVQPAPAPDPAAEDWCAMDDRGCVELARERLAVLLPALAEVPPDAARAEVSLAMRHVLPVAERASNLPHATRRDARRELCSLLPTSLQGHPRCPPPLPDPFEHIVCIQPVDDLDGLEDL